MRRHQTDACPAQERAEAEPSTYAYLFGQYLGAHPQRFLRGLIEPDGCRVINRVNGGEYPRYLSSNASADIMALCIRTIEQLGLHWTRANSRNITIARRADVEYLDAFIGPKWWVR